eukprot:1798-Eustigmatos_ZCMA.PRE.1
MSKLSGISLIMVHTQVLASQWVDRIHHFLEGARVLLIKPEKDIPSLEGVTHVLCLMQTLLALKKRNSVGWLEGLHDMIVIDETHHLCAKTLSA